MKKILIILIPLILIATITIAYFFFFPEEEIKPDKTLKQSTFLTQCLSENLEVSYKIEEKESPLADVVVYIIDENTGKEVTSFKIDNIFKNYHPIELYKCGIYVIRFFNYDPRISKQKPEFRAEFWRYYYSGEGIQLFFSEDFSYDFRVDPTEIYLVLERSYLGNPDYALVIKNLQTKKDVFVLPLKEITDKYPDFLGSIGFNEWTRGSKYFWGNIFDGANVLAFFRIERDSWKRELFEAPTGTMGGTALNSEFGYITYDDGPPWTGDLDFAKMYQEQWEKEGKIVSFYLYNFFTNKKIVLATTTDTMWYFKPKWISDTELEYYLPSGERKIYAVK
ncbi:hypothetical protein KJ671_03590 [Patescibacteria group bacterium]|nr:hypothetical protein [Patescibacteria group bacterium]